MNKIITATALILGIITNSVSAATVNVGSYTLDNSALVSSYNVLTEPGTIYTNAGSSAITDADPSTYVYGNPSGTINLGFDTNIYNSSSSTDLVFFFLRNNTTFDLTINNQTQSFTSSLQTFDNNTKKYQVEVGAEFFDLTAVEVELDLFGIGTNQFINSMSVGLDTNEFLALTGGFNTSPTPVPLPAAVWLFMSGLAIFGWFGRRK